MRQEFTTFHPRAEDRRALAASPSAISLSVVSPSCDPASTALDRQESRFERWHMER